MRNPSTMKDLFLSHDWGTNCQNHNRVVNLNHMLTDNELTTWLDAYDLKSDILKSVREGIKQSRKVVIFITENYINKANGHGPNGRGDYCYQEFEYALQNLGKREIILILMDRKVRNPHEWEGKFGKVFRDELYIDFSDDAFIEQCVYDVYTRIHCPGSNLVPRHFAEGIYEGVLNLNGERHGFGKMKYKVNFKKSGGVYQGMFLNGRKEGLGKYTNRRNDIYIGTFKDEKKRGHGRLTMVNGSCYVGSFLDDKFNGLGTYKTSEGDLYAGTFENGALNGYGKMQYADSSEYNGSLRNGNFHGAGSYKSCNNDAYIGEFCNHQFHGEGILKYSNGFEYNGFFEKGHFSGKGAYKTKDGDSYEGYFKEHMFHGEGKMVYTNGDIFDGRWKYGKSIDGTRIYANGDTYSGHWRNDLRHGNGTFMFATGDTYEGQYRNGERNGKGTYTFVHGGKYEGAWLDGVRHGYGVRVHPDGAMFKGIYSKGARKEGRIDFANKVVYEGSILESITKEATSDGSVIQEKKIGMLKKGTLDFERTVPKKKIRHRVASLLRGPTLYGVEWSLGAAKPNFRALHGLKLRMGQHQPSTQNLLQMISICSNPLPSSNLREISQKSECEKTPVIAALGIPTSSFKKGSFKKGTLRLQVPHESQDEKGSPRSATDFMFSTDSGTESTLPEPRMVLEEGVPVGPQK